MTKELLKKELGRSFKNIGKSIDPHLQAKIMSSVVAYYDYVDKSGVDSFTKVSYIVKIYIEQIQKDDRISNKKVNDHIYNEVFKFGLKLLKEPIEYKNYPDVYFKNEETKLIYDNPRFGQYLIKDSAVLGVWQSAFRQWVRNSKAYHSIDALSTLYKDAYEYSISTKNNDTIPRIRVLQKVKEGVKNNEAV